MLKSLRHQIVNVKPVITMRQTIDLGNRSMDNLFSLVLLVSLALGCGSQKGLKETGRCVSPAKLVQESKDRTPLRADINDDGVEDLMVSSGCRGANCNFRAYVVRNECGYFAGDIYGDGFVGIGPSRAGMNDIYMSIGHQHFSEDVVFWFQSGEYQCRHRRKAPFGTWQDC